MDDELPPGDEPPDGPGEEFYAQQFDRLTEMAVREYALDRDAAEELAGEVLIAFIPRAGRIANPTQWLDATMRGAGKKLREAGGPR
jgi:hypothetical protein